MKRNTFISFSPDCINTWIINAQSITQIFVLYAPNKSVNKVTCDLVMLPTNERTSSSFCYANTHITGLCVLSNSHVSVKVGSPQPWSFLGETEQIVA